MKMRSNCLMLLFFAGVVFISCDDDGGSGTRSVIIAGDPEGAAFFSELAEPDTMIYTKVHTATRDFDLDDDGRMDITIISERDTIYDAGLAVRTTRQLSIVATDPQDNPLFVSTLNQLVRIYGRGIVINLNNSIWTALTSTPMILASSDQDLTSGQTDIGGNWNSTIQQSMGFLLPGDPEIMAWLELSVLGIDSYVYHDHASFTLD